jgi:undecaprenyl diphosphate synthase
MKPDLDCDGVIVAPQVRRKRKRPMVAAACCEARESLVGRFPSSPINSCLSALGRNQRNRVGSLLRFTFILVLARCFKPVRCYSRAYWSHRPTTTLARSQSIMNMVMPRHVALICDGNGRWAKQRGLPTYVGHMTGADRLNSLLDALLSSNQYHSIEYCTLYGFSTENWSRPPSEVAAILRVMERSVRMFLMSRAPGAGQRPLRVKILGNIDHDPRIPLSLRQVLHELEDMTATSASENADSGLPLTVMLAINYGGRQDIVQATQRLLHDIVQQKIQDHCDGRESAPLLTTLTQDVTEESISRYLGTAGVPDPDLVIRTSGEQRVSNFLLWNIAYSEFYFTDVHWPDFSMTQFDDAILWYLSRQRRYGKRPLSATDSSAGPELTIHLSTFREGNHPYRNDTLTASPILPQELYNETERLAAV